MNEIGNKVQTKWIKLMLGKYHHGVSCQVGFHIQNEDSHFR